MPWVKDDCKGCGDCLDSCPADAITLEDGRAKIDNVICSKCGSCFEACPFDLIRPNSENPELRGDFGGKGLGSGRGGGERRKKRGSPGRGQGKERR
ncbi:MAG: indolepyruvate ferredoxin oxidoreductase subunit alpha [Candidatus Acetothermia bacterium]